MINGHDDLCPYDEYVKNNLGTLVCTYCELIRKVRAQP